MCGFIYFLFWYRQIMPLSFAAILQQRGYRKAIIKIAGKHIMMLIRIFESYRYKQNKRR